MKASSLTVGLLLTIGLVKVVLAHHSTANFNFDEGERQTIKGEVTYWSFSNPHSYIDVDVATDDESINQYTVFLTSRVVLQRYGWRPSSLNTGDIIEIEGSPDRTKAREMYLQRIVFPDGKEWRRDEVAR